MLNTLSLQMSFYRKDYHTQKCLYFELIHSTILTRMKNLYYFEFIYDWEDLIQYLYSKLSSSTDNQIIQLHGDMITIWK
ncbi:unnamed protein product [Didymodactylos carnosus]|uniref:Uncharacterized protein n=3 Tax=Didymodactylos carnosus TaxID=1234261 RepID=A0A8S2GBX5_9BILA|nr:unnamed protein product [Didymodactylos carnosus]CAF4567695.1 unnamed protein product [Didymodactylos carnosus]